MKRNSKLLILVCFFSVSTNLFSIFNGIHPLFPLRDKNGEKVILSGKPFSSVNSCGNCHDTAFITENTSHHFSGKKDSNLKNQESKMACLLCHIATSGINKMELPPVADEWISSLPFAESGVLTIGSDSCYWNISLFDKEGNLKRDAIKLSSPSVKNCGFCHNFGSIGDSTVNNEKIKLSGGELLKKGIIFSGEKISDSGLNIKNKQALSVSFDVHAERLLTCTDCHYSQNNPMIQDNSARKLVSHLKYEVRKISLNDFLIRPSHFFNGETRTFTATDISENKFSIKKEFCINCHDTVRNHNWLSYKETHFNKLGCTVCHIPFVPNSALMFSDRTLKDNNGESLIFKRGINLDNKTSPDFIEGFTPFYLPVETAEGTLKIYPVNISSELFWKEKEEPEPELSINIYQLSHGITPKSRALKTCEACHSEKSILLQGMVITPFIPPINLKKIKLPPRTSLFQDKRNGLMLFPDFSQEKLYIGGRKKNNPADRLGFILLALSISGAFFHGALRLLKLKVGRKK